MNFLKGILSHVSRRWIEYLVTLAVVTVLAYLGVPVPKLDVPDEPLIVFPDGWVRDDEAVAKVVAGHEFKSFSETPASKVVRGDDDDAFLWLAWVKILGKNPEPRNQKSVGSCVGFGYTLGAKLLLAIQIASGSGQEYGELVEEVPYAGSRVEIGGGRIRGDGSVGAWAAEWSRKGGYLVRRQYGSLDLREYSEDRCRSWGRSGVPDDLEPIARLNIVRDVVLCKSADEARKALQNGYPVAVCSDQGFSQERDRDGFARADRKWAHCMCVIGYQGGARKGFFIQNSWGKTYHRGPLGKGSPPEGGFWAEWSVVDRMLRQGDSFALADIKGFPGKKIDWLVKGEANANDAMFAVGR